MTADVAADLTAQWATDNTQPPDPNEGFFTDIDEAMKKKISGIRVNELKTGADRRLVRAYFRWPDVEVTDQTFPFLTLDLLRYYRAADREHRAGHYPLAYAPKNYAPLPDDDDDRWLVTEMPIPYDFVYAVTAHARSTTQMREIEYAMLQNDRLAPRGAYLQVGDTVRYMEVDGPVNASGMDPQPGGRSKRHIRWVWTVTVQTELFQSTIEELAAAGSLVLAVDVDTALTE